MTPRALLLGTAIALTLPAVARAQSSGASTAAAPGADAEQLLQQGVALRRAGNDAGALELFQRAYQRTPSPRAAAQMGLAEQALGRWAAADTHLREALGHADDPFIRQYHDTIARALAQVEPRVARVEVISQTPGAVLSVNGRQIGTLPLAAPVAVPAGTVLLRVEAPGFHAIERSIDAPGARLSRESIDLVARTDEPEPTPPVAPTPVTPTPVAPVAVAPVAPIPETPRRPESHGLAPAYVYTGIAVTAVSAVVLGAFVVAAGTTYAQYQANAAGPDALSLYANGLTFQDTADAMIPVTAVLGAATLVLAVFTDWHRGEHRPAATAELRWAPTLTATSGGSTMGVRGVF